MFAPIRPSPTIAICTTSPSVLPPQLIRTLARATGGAYRKSAEGVTGGLRPRAERDLREEGVQPSGGRVGEPAGTRELR